MGKKSILPRTFVNGEPVDFLLIGPAIMDMECCDCGLVHTLIFEHKDDSLVISTFRNDFLTVKYRAERRKQKEKKK